MSEEAGGIKTEKIRYFDGNSAEKNPPEPYQQDF
jgi:hypothetical protein